MANKQTYFGRELFRFFEELRDHNDRAWFEENKPRFERDVREPLLAFISDFGAHLAKISPYFVADPRKQGGSLFRINRDTRFSKDKTPYKTHAGVHFRHEATTKDVHAPGFYLHLQPGGVFVGGGLWHPATGPLQQIRESLVEKPAEWKKALAVRAFRASFELGGDALKRPPRGFDADHPLIEDLKRKDFVFSTNLTEKDVVAPGFIDELAKLYKAIAPPMAFLTRAVGLSF